MGLMSQLLMLAAALFIGWMAYRFIRQNPGSLSRENVSKSVTTLGVLALLLIALVGFLVILIR
jgi:hypothetical protein